MTPHVPPSPRCFFEALTSCNLEVRAFRCIRDPAERLFAAEILMMRAPARSEFVLRVFAERTKRRSIRIVKNDRLGIELHLTLVRPSGALCLRLHRKRTVSVDVRFMDTNYDTKHPLFSFGSDCCASWVRCLMHEYEPFLVRYVRDGLSGRLRDVKRLVRQCFSDSCESACSVHIDIPGYICLIDAL